MESLNPSTISTNYYKFGHIRGVKYSSYQLEISNDQALLELELAIRFKCPNLILTYYNKSLYHFEFDHTPPNSDWIKDYPQLILKSSKSISLDQLCNPSKTPASTATPNNLDNEQASTTPNEHPPFIGISLLKAIKKLVLYKLSKQGALRIFGNYAIINCDQVTNNIILIEPVMLPNGDLLLCVIQKTSLQLYDSSILSIENPDIDKTSDFVIYLTPSGIRCHLFDSLKILSSFTHTPPKNHENILHLLKLATGIDLSQEDNLLWVKLIPNLQHLNNQTSKIAKFIHTVDNKKFIMWPWKFCLLQFGKYEHSIDLARSKTTTDNNYHSIKDPDPFNLISEFMDFNITIKHHIQQSGLHHQSHNPGSVNFPSSFNVPSVVSTGIGSTDPKNDASMDMNDMNMLPDLFTGMPPAVGGDFFSNEIDMMDSMNKLEQYENNDDLKQQNLPGVENSETFQDGNDEMDDLFGNYSGSEDDDRKAEDVIQTGDPEDLTTMKNDEQNMTQLFESSDQFRPTGDLFETKDPKEFTKESSTFDIPKEQMAIQVKEPTPYDDPGAPLPIMPTPVISQQAERRSAAPDSDIGSSKSAFSPILFNPLIKSNVDDKYGKGGKFYFDKDSNKDIETPLKNYRATSVSGYAIRRSSGTQEPKERKGLGIDFNSDSRVFFESDDDEENSFDGGFGDYDLDEFGKLPNVNGTDDKNSSKLEKEGLRIDFAEDMEDDDEEEEESDEDADINLGRDSPLKLNTQADPFSFQNPAGVAPVSEQPPTVRAQYAFNPTNLTGGFSSPLSGMIPPPSMRLSALPKFDSPFAMHESPGDEKQKYSSPLVVDIDDGKRSSQSIVPPTSNPVSNAISTREANTVNESSNCLPLILRGVNIYSIPNEFLLNNIMGAIKMSASASDFDMNVDQDDDDSEISKKNEMNIKVEHLSEFLNWLGPNLIFDLGLNNFKKNLTSNIPQNFKEYQSSKYHRIVEYDLIPINFQKTLISSFPLSYNMRLEEMLSDLLEVKTKDPYSMDNQLSFLDDITNDEILNPKSKLKKLDMIEWDSLDLENTRNEESFREYIGVVRDIRENSLFDVSESMKTMSENKIKVLKNKTDIVNLNSISIKFWKYLGFDPVYGPKNFQIILISETLNENMNYKYNQDFLDSLIYNYKDTNFGSISKISLQSSDSRPDLENINDGLIVINSNDDNYNHVYRQINKKLNSLVELIKLDLINKTNRFEFDRPLLLLFLNFNKNFNSLLEISKICRNFKTFLRRHQLPLVQVFSKIIPADFVVKEYNDRRSLRYLSNYKLTKLSMNLYNQCPDPIETTGPNKTFEPTASLFTNIVKEPISKLNFKFFNNSSKDTYSDDDAFLHLAYERSVDKNWVSAAWSDPLGIVTYTKSWCNSSSLLKSSNHQTPNNQGGHTEGYINNNVYDLQSISNQILEISNELFKKLNEEIIKRTSGLGGKKFLVLTRVNSIIPDEELVHWKRLSMKYKDISLIVLSVNNSPKTSFKNGVTETEDNTEKSITGTDMTNSRSQEPDLMNIEIQQSPKDLLSDVQSKSAKETNQDQQNEFFKSFNNMPQSNNPSPNNNLLSSNFSFGLNNGVNFLSPDPSGPSLTNQMTGGTKNENDTNIKDMILQDFNDIVVGIIPTTPIPSTSTPTRPAMKVGYLIKQADPTEQTYLVFEVHLLSCSNYWNLKSLMTIILNHYKKLITLNDILGTRNIDNSSEDDVEKENYVSSGLIPWHIAAVTKSLNYLIHIDVRE